MFAQRSSRAVITPPPYLSIYLPLKTIVTIKTKINYHTETPKTRCTKGKGQDSRNGQVWVIIAGAAGVIVPTRLLRAKGMDATNAVSALAGPKKNLRRLASWTSSAVCCFAKATSRKVTGRP